MAPVHLGVLGSSEADPDHTIRSTATNNDRLRSVLLLCCTPADSEQRTYRQQNARLHSSPPVGFPRPSSVTTGYVFRSSPTPLPAPETRHISPLWKPGNGVGGLLTPVFGALVVRFGVLQTSVESLPAFGLLPFLPQLPLLLSAIRRFLGMIPVIGCVVGHPLLSLI